MSNIDETEKRLQDLEEKVEQLTTLFNKMNDTKQQVVHYHIKTLEIQNAKIEKLDYHLDSIGIEQLSGTLNIGNNFDAKQPTPIQKPTFKKDKHYKEKIRTSYRPFIKHNNQSEESRHISVTNRKSGFSVKINGKEES
ncbi:spore germination protein GerPC [Sutcliffiella horikoshii]|uniref:spore germination protein GerPC n=1 Tax=Sutcliffiella horikoshii TaxID=79883 RepID=UPI00384C6539